MRIPRLQAVELEDLSWFPVMFRDLHTDSLRFIENKLRLHEPIVPLLKNLLMETGSEQIVDLGSGGGGPVPSICEALHAEGIEAHFILTDLYPNVAAFQRISSGSDGRITFSSDPISASAVPRSLTGVRTVFNAFHHFPPEMARAVLEDAVAAGQPFAAFEINNRSVPAILAAASTVLLPWLVTPFVRPFQWRRLLWTYLIPILPLTFIWDAVASQLRAYTCSELESLSGPLAERGYIWTVGRVAITRKFGRFTYLMGRPIDSA